MLCSVLSTVMCQVPEVYVCRVQIAYSLMRPLVVPVLHEFFVGWVDPGFIGVGFVECSDLSDGGWSPYACDYVLDAVSIAEFC